MLKNTLVYVLISTTINTLKLFTQVYVLTNGIFASARSDNGDGLSMVRHVPLVSIHLGRVEAVNERQKNILFEKRKRGVYEFAACRGICPSRVAAVAGRTRGRTGLLGGKEGKVGGF